MADFAYKKTNLKKFAAVQQRETAEGRYWRRFRHRSVQTFTAPCTSLHFSPVAPFNLAVSTSLSVLLLDPKTQKPNKMLSRFNDVAYSARYRHDGRLVAAGGEEGIVRTFEASSGSSLRHLRGHSAPVHAVRWSLDGLHIFSASDDKSVKLWDVPTQQCLWTRSEGHSDYARTAAVSPVSPHMWASGGYDHTVLLWDSRDRVSTQPVVRIDHGAPVEDVLFLPGGSLLLSAAGNSIKVWDILGGGKMVHTLSNHQKTITSLCLDSTRSRLISGGLDGHVKIYSLDTFEVTHGLKYDAPVLSVAISPDNMQLVVGTSDGALTSRHHAVKQSGTSSSKQPRPTLPPEQVAGGSLKFFERGKNLKTAGGDGSNRSVSLGAEGVASSGGTGGDLQVLLHRRQRLRPYDTALRKFKYHDALDAALTSRNPTVVITVLEELAHRQGLRRAVAGRDEVTLEPLLSFLARYTTNPRYATFLIDVCHVVFDMYKAVIGQSEAIDELFTRLGRQVKLEIGLHKDLMRLLGTMDTVMTGGHTAISETDQVSKSGTSH
mmetsp:Transcript_71652/g.144239  ORF Transcript_71652/g.144239 Transcript_71652/m.144239 type:complete len:546 (+) Transcript_71652:29-1666(+)